MRQTKNRQSIFNLYDKMNYLPKQRKTTVPKLSNNNANYALEDEINGFTKQPISDLIPADFPRSTPLRDTVQHSRLRKVAPLSHWSSPLTTVHHLVPQRQTSENRSANETRRSRRLAEGCRPGPARAVPQRHVRHAVLLDDDQRQIAVGERSR